jgi:hypothetical protein
MMALSILNAITKNKRIKIMPNDRHRTRDKAHEKHDLMIKRYLRSEGWMGQVKAPKRYKKLRRLEKRADRFLKRVEGFFASYTQHERKGFELMHSMALRDTFMSGDDWHTETKGKTLAIMGEPTLPPRYMRAARLASAPMHITIKPISEHVPVPQDISEWAKTYNEQAISRGCFLNKSLGIPFDDGLEVKISGSHFVPAVSDKIRIIMKDEDNKDNENKK